MNYPFKAKREDMMEKIKKLSEAKPGVLVITIGIVFE